MARDPFAKEPLILHQTPEPWVQIKKLKNCAVSDVFPVIAHQGQMGTGISFAVRRHQIRTVITTTRFKKTIKL